MTTPNQPRDLAAPSDETLATELLRLRDRGHLDYADIYAAFDKVRDHTAAAERRRAAAIVDSTPIPLHFGSCISPAAELICGIANRIRETAMEAPDAKRT